MCKLLLSAPPILADSTSTLQGGISSSRIPVPFKAFPFEGLSPRLDLSFPFSFCFPFACKSCVLLCGL